MKLLKHLSTKSGVDGNGSLHITGENGQILSIKFIQENIIRVSYLPSERVVKNTYSTSISAPQTTSLVLTPTEGFYRSSIKSTSKNTAVSGDGFAQSEGLKVEVVTSKDRLVGMKFIDRKKGMTLAEDYSYAGDGRVCVHKMNMTRRGGLAEEERSDDSVAIEQQLICPPTSS